MFSCMCQELMNIFLTSCKLVCHNNYYNNNVQLDECKVQFHDAESELSLTKSRLGSTCEVSTLCMYIYVFKAMLYV